jgi:hypothetical protein
MILELDGHGLTQDPVVQCVPDDVIVVAHDGFRGVKSRPHGRYDVGTRWLEWQREWEGGRDHLQEDQVLPTNEDVIVDVPGNQSIDHGAWEGLLVPMASWVVDPKLDLY